MDIKKLKLDESQINKMTGRIILPADDVSPSPPPVAHKVQMPRVANTDETGTAPTPPMGSVLGGTGIPATPGVSYVQPSPVSPVMALVVGILVTLLVVQTSWLLWSHSQVQESMRAMHDQILKLNTEVGASGEALRAATREINEMKVMMGRTVEEQKNQAKITAAIKAQLDSFDSDPAPVAAPVLP